MPPLHSHIVTCKWRNSKGRTPDWGRGAIWGTGPLAGIPQITSEMEPHQSPLSLPCSALPFPCGQFFKFIPKATGSSVYREQTRNPPCGYGELRGLLGLWLFYFFTSLELFDQDCHCLYTRGVQFSPSVVSDSLRPHGLQHARPPCPSPIPRVYSNSCPLSW